MTPYHPNTPWPKIGLPTRYDGTEFPDGHKPWVETGKNAWHIVRRGGIVVLNGNYGTGKTCMAYWLAVSAGHTPDPYFPPNPPLADHRRPVRYYVASELFDAIKATYAQNSPISAARLTEDLVDASILVVDELSKGLKGEHDAGKLTRILDSRWMHKRPSILIANFDMRSIETALDGSIQDRIAECGAILNFGWGSFRGNARIMP